MPFILILTTCPNASVAEKIARVLIQKRLAACVQISAPVKSIYRWKGRIQNEKEVQVWIKTRASHWKSVSHKICLLHPYEVPEIICISIKEGFKNYLNWMKQETV